MKIIAVGDIHGRDTWKKVLEQESDYDHFVFVGDYFDAFPPMTPERILSNFKELLAFKSCNPDKVHLLLGNHDFQYTPWGQQFDEKYSGYNSITKLNLEELGNWWEYCHAAYQYQDILFTHAGLTKTWAEKWFPEGAFAAMTADWIQRTWERHPKAFVFYDEDRSLCGDDKNQSPFWVRPEALLGDAYPDLRMVVGHTHTDGIHTIGPLTMIDTGKQGEYLRIIGGVMETGII